MPNTAIILRAKTEVEGLTLLVDGFPDEVHRLRSRAGKEPIARGRSVADQVSAEPQIITLTGIVSDMTGGAPRVTVAAQTIKNYWLNSTPLRVMTEWGIIDEMFILRCDLIKEGLGMRVEVDLQEIRRFTPVYPDSPPTDYSTQPGFGVSDEVGQEAVARRGAELMRGKDAFQFFGAPGDPAIGTDAAYDAVISAQRQARIDKVRSDFDGLDEVELDLFSSLDSGTPQPGGDDAFIIEIAGVEVDLGFLKSFGEGLLGNGG